MQLPINNDWYFLETYDEALPLLQSAAELPSLVPVRLPHTVRLLPGNCFSERAYGTLSGYVRFFDAPETWRGKRVFVTFEGAAHEATVFSNGVRVGLHRCGYTAFTVELTDSLRYGAQNTLAVRLDSRETLDIPPFGGAVDYMTFGGLYREAALTVTEQSYLADVFVQADMDGNTVCETECVNPGGLRLAVRVRDEASRILKETEVDATKHALSLRVDDVRRWRCEDPALYALEASLIDGESVVDRKYIRFGFRTAEFRTDGFYLNGEKVKLRGLNRHQSYPYLGYAAPARAQRLDADILKFELGLNAVRTSHYPQSRHFIDRCDELGLLVFTEIPGWQHIGGDAWKAQAIENTADMVRQYRNHPSIVLWGVRINESADDDALYAETNRVAHSLDPSRATSGVRCTKKSRLLEDVYAYNDFIHSGNNIGCEKKAAVTPDMEKGYLVSEYCGHMYPTKPCDDEAHRLSHALRHARILNDIASESNIAGGFGWCMFDYHTHKDFGSGDRVCYHGVLDMFRNPKLAAAVYASQSDAFPVLAVSSSMDIGEHPAGALGELAVFTNADEVRLYKNGAFVGGFAPSRVYGNLMHPPVLIQDTVGKLMEQNEGYSPRTSALVKDVLFAAAKYGQAGLPLSVKLKAAYLMLVKRFTYAESLRLFNTYLTSWGDKTVSWRFDAVKDGAVVASVTKAPGERLFLRLVADTDTLAEGDTWDMATVRIRAVDEYENVATYCARAVTLHAEGAVRLIGPASVPLSGGMAGCYLATCGVLGEGRLVATMDGAAPVTLPVTVM